MAAVDLDSDGFDDLLAWESGATVEGTIQAGRLWILRGPHLELCDVFEPPPEAGLPGEESTAVGDVDGDGSIDVLAGAPHGLRNGKARLFLGPDFQREIQFLNLAVSPTMDVGFGGHRTSGDFDGDGFPEIAVYVQGSSSSGSISLYDLRTLEAAPEGLSLASGGAVSFHLRGGHDRAELRYVGLLSLSGSFPGTFLGHGAWLPLNIDPLTSAGLAHIFGPWLPGFSGRLDEQGMADFQLALPPGLPTNLIGQTITVSAVVFGPQHRFVMASSAAGIDLQP